MHGKGIFTWPNDNYYDGNFLNGKKNGRGIFYWNDNRTYDGFWKNGKKHGLGVFTDANGK